MDGSSPNIINKYIYCLNNNIEKSKKWMDGMFVWTNCKRTEITNRSNHNRGC